MLKKLICSLFIATILVSTVSVPASAECPYGHGNDFISHTCSSILYSVKTIDCSWAGGYGGSYYHPSNCQIVQYRYYTTEYCTICSHSTSSGYHLCYADHPQCGYYIDVCPY